MKREDLKALELTDEQIDSVMQMQGEDLNALKAEKSNLQTQNGDLQKQITDRDKQLTELRRQAGTDAELQAKIDQLTEDNKKAKTDYEQKMTQMKLDHAVDTALISAKAKNPKAAKALLKMDDLKLNTEGEVVGLKEQIDGLTESDAYLFGADKPTGTPPPEGAKSEPEGLASTMAKQFNEQSSGTLDW